VYEALSYQCLRQISDKCPHTAIHVSSYHFICVLMLLSVSSYYCMCPHTSVYVCRGVHAADGGRRPVINIYIYINIYYIICIYIYIIFIYIYIYIRAEVLTGLMEVDDDSMCAHTSVYVCRGVHAADGGRRRQHVLKHSHNRNHNRSVSR
jgi:hypothetical protein